MSDFRFDDADQLVAQLQNQARWVGLWQVGRSESVQAAGGQGAAIGAIQLPADLLPDRPGIADVTVLGPAESLYVAFNDEVEQALAIPVDGRVQVPVPRLPSGMHRMRLRLAHRGLEAASSITVPVQVRDAIPVVQVGNDLSTLRAALQAAPAEVSVRRLSAVELAQEPLPQGGALMAGAPLADTARVVDWVTAGGLLIVDWQRVQADDVLAGIFHDVVFPSLPRN